jgi:hypothetical protein
MADPVAGGSGWGREGEAAAGEREGGLELRVWGVGRAVYIGNVFGLGGPAAVMG